MPQKVKCGAKCRDGSPCEAWAVKGGRRCRMHGGKGQGGVQNSNYQHGGYAFSASEALEEKRQEHMGRADPLNLTGELATLRALYEQFLGRLTDTVSAEEMEFAAVHAERIGRMAERITKMLNDTALTQHEIEHTQERVASIILTYVPAAQQDACADEIRQAFGLG